MKYSVFAAAAFLAAAVFAEKKHPDLTGIYGPDVKTIGIAAISSKVPLGSFSAVTNRLAQAGYRMKVAANVPERKIASPERRARLMEELWMDPEVDLLVFAYGGKGAADVIEVVDWEKLKKRDMRVIGFSDLTMLVNTMLVKGAGHPFTGPVLTTLGYSNAAAVKRMREMMSGNPGGVKLQVVKSTNKTVEGLPMGGLLDRLHKLTVAGKLPDTAGRVIFIENTNRYAPRTEEMLGEMTAKGVFDKAVAVVICDFNSKSPKDETRKLLEKFAAKIPCPVFSRFPYGHISNTSIIDFRRALAISADGKLVWKP